MASVNVEDLLVLLMDVPFDEGDIVSNKMCQSLHELGCSHPEVVLMFCREYLLKHKRLLAVHRAVLLKSLKLIVRDTIAYLTRPMAKKLIYLASMEIIKCKDVLPEHQEAASNLLVTLGCRFTNEVLDEMLSMFHQGSVPHFYVMLTLANLCTANVHHIVPMLKPILHTTLTMLPMVTQEKMKWVFCLALGLFSESILAYLSDIDEAPDPTVKKNLFFTEISAAYDILFSIWLPIKESKVGTAVVETIGQLTHLMPYDKLENELPNLIPTVLSMYKKNSSDFCITQGLCGILHAAMERGSEVLGFQLESLLLSLHNQICIPVDSANHFSNKNHNEVLCCFKVMAPSFSEQITEFLLLQLEANNEQTRIGTLIVLKHLITAVPSSLESKKPRILEGMKLPLLDNNNKVKRMVAQVIYSMANRGYLELEGGKAMVEFIIRQCALPVVETDPNVCLPLSDDISDKDIKRLCEVIMNIITTTERMENVLWPFLLEFVVTMRYTNALATVCRCLVHLGTKKQTNEAQDFFLCYVKHPTLPKPHALLTRLLIVSSSPYQGKGRGAPALTLLQIMGPNIHEAVIKVWEKELPVLVDFLMQNSELLVDQQQWENQLLLVLSRTLEVIADDAWIYQLSEEIIKHVHCYHHYPQEKGFLFKCLGVVLQHTQNKDVVKKNLQEMMQNVQHSEPLEREGVATGFGYCATTHLDTTLNKLKDYGKLNIFKKTASFFHILKDQSDIEMIKVKSTLILCYGYVILHSPENLILSRIETDILQNVLSNFNIKILGIKVEIKDLTVKLSLIKTVTLIARAFNSNRQCPSFKFTRRGELLVYMQELIKAEPTEVLKTSIRKSAINACIFLSKLEPPLKEEDTSELIKICLKSVINLPQPETDSSKEDTNVEVEDRGMLYNETMTSLQDLLKQILLLDLSPNGFQSVFKHVNAWIKSAKDNERTKAMEITSHLLMFYLEKLHVSNEVTFHNLGVIVGEMVPRCTDPLPIVRQAAIDSLYTLLYIQLRCEGFAADHRDIIVEHLKTIRSGLDHLNSLLLFRTCADIGKILSKRMPQDQMNDLLFTVFKGLTEVHPNCSCASAIVMNILIRRRGASLEEVPEIIRVLHTQSQFVTQEPVARSVTHCISILASQNVPMVLPCLLTYPLPFDKYVSDIWKSLLRDKGLAVTAIKYLLDNLKLLYDDSKESLLTSNVIGAAAEQPLHVISALREMLIDPDSEMVVSKLYPQLFSTLLIHLSASVRVHLSKDFLNSSKDRKTASFLPQLAKNVEASNCCVEILQAILAHGKTENEMKLMNETGVWDLIKDPKRHHEGVSMLAKVMSSCAIPHLINIAEQLAPVLVNIHESQRITVAAYFAELLNHSVVSELQLTDTLVGNLLRCLIDTSAAVRWLSIRGLGNAAIGASNKIEKYSTKLLSAMISVLDEKYEPSNLIILEAMSGISKILAKMEKENDNPILLEVTLAIQPFFERDNDRVRAAAFVVLGSLIRFGDKQLKPVFMEQIYSCLTSLLLHLHDRSSEVILICKSVLATVGPIMESVCICELFEELLFENILEYEEFLCNVSKHLSRDSSEKIPFYITGCVPFFSSAQPEIRENAVTFIGFLMQHAPPDFPRSAAADQICNEIITLLLDPIPSVRIKAAKAIMLLYEY